MTFLCECGACQLSRSGRIPAQYIAAHNRRRSNAAGKHGDRRLKRLRDRGARKRAALKEEQS